MLFIRFLSIISLIGSIIWMVLTPGFEPGITIIASLSTLIGNFMFEKRKKNSFIQNQKVNNKSIGIQAGGAVSIYKDRESDQT